MRNEFLLGIAQDSPGQVSTRQGQGDFADHARIKNEWQNLISRRPVNTKVVREIVYDSWKRSLDYNVDPYYIGTAQAAAAEEDIIFRLNRANELVNASWPFVQELGNLVAGSGFKINLLDDECYSLKVIGDQKTIDRGDSVGICVGTNRSEKSVGTNAAGLAMAVDMPVQLNGPEHYNVSAWDWTCSASPIHDPSGRIIGVVSVAGHINLSHKHTLGMVISIVNAIEKMLSLRRLNQKNEDFFRLNSASLRLK